MELLRNYLTEIYERKKLIYFALLGVLLALLVVVSSYFLWFNERIVTGVSVAGVDVGGMHITEVTKLLKKEYEPMLQKKVILNYNKRTFGVVLGTIGIKPDFDKTLNAAYRIGRSGSILARINQRVRVNRNGFKMGLKYSNNQPTLDSFYYLLEASIAVEPVRSVVYINSESKVRYSASKDGKMIAKNQLTRLLETAVMQKDLEQIDIPINVVRPSLTENDIQRWKMDQVLGIYETKFNKDLTDRVQNLKIASGALDNVIIYPGQNFSFNTWVGPRVSEVGYKEAPVVLYGKLVPGIGGGVCQVSTTLYNAVLLANLKTIKRHNHTLPIAYVPLGRDAAVVYDGLDFIFENNLSTPILLTAVVEPPYIRVAVLGEKTDWDQVSLKTEILEIYPFKIKEEYDQTLEPEARVKEEDGRKGYKLVLWRTIRYKDGVEKTYLENTSFYPSQPEKYKVGTKPQ